MEDLIKALQILSKYTKGDATRCEHEEFRVWLREGAEVTQQDVEALDALGFIPDDGFEGECFISYRFGG